MLPLLPLRRGRGGGLCNLASRWVSSVGATARESADAVVIGAGVVGLAVARDLALRGREVLVLDSAPTFGTATSSRNSEVIHAGIYYPPNSLKANLCVRGRKLLYKFCKDRGIPHKQIGKLIVATGFAEIPKLNDLLRRGTDNGVEGLAMMESSEAIQLEPELYCLKALMSPNSGIVDSHSFMLSLMHLIYPIPEDGGLGVHVTIDLDGQVKFGPDVEWIDAIGDTSAFLNRFDYTVDPNRSRRFYPEIKRYYPNLKDGILEPGHAGIRAKLSGPGQPSADFIIQGEDDHGVPGLVNLFGIESPGLTSSLAIAEYISSKFLR